MNKDSDGGLVSPSDIARLAKVTRAAVSNWRRRRTDFPSPTSGTVANPLFSRTVVEGWLADNGRRVGRETGELSTWATMNKYRGQIPIGSMVAVLHALLCARKLSDEQPMWQDLREAAAKGRLTKRLSRAAGDFGDTRLRIPEGPASTRTQMESFASELLWVIDDLGVDELANLSDQIIGRAFSPEGRTGGDSFLVGARVAGVLAQCAADGDGIAYDPACGIGDTLLAIWKLKNAGGLELVGHENDEAAVLLARQRCFLHDVPARIVKADVLSTDVDPTLRAHVIATQLPLGMQSAHDLSVTDPRWAIAGPPPPKNPEGAWLQDAIAHLEPQGRGYLLANPNTTFSAGAAEMRRLLCHAGSVEAIVGLPPKMAAQTAIPTVLWVVCRPGASRFLNSVLVIDASGLDPSADLPVKDWLAEPEKIDSKKIAWARVPMSDVLADEEVSLSPRGLTESKVDPAEIADRYTKVRTQLVAASRAIDLDGLATESLVVPRSHVATIRQLERQGVVAVLKTRSRRDTDEIGVGEDDPRIVTVRTIKEGLPEMRAKSDLAGFDQGSLTEPGEILVTTNRTIYAVVDEAGGRLAQSGVIRLWVDKAEFDPRYIAACLSAGWNQRFETGFYVPHANIRDLEVPLIPLSNQEQVVRKVDRARSTADAAELAASAAADFADVVLEAVRFNVSTQQLGIQTGGAGTAYSRPAEP